MYNNGNSSKNVTGASVVDGTLENADFADNTISGDKIDAGVISNFQSTGIDDRLSTGKNITVSDSNTTLDNNFAFSGTTGNKWLFFPDTANHTGRLSIQTGYGSAQAGGALTLYGHSHATNPGDVNIGMSNIIGDFTITKSVANGGSELIRVLHNGGLTFNGDTAAANALDDYEEGTWTPTADQGCTGFTKNSAYYVKIGKLVTIQMFLSSFTGKDANQLVIGGLPFNVGANNDYYVGIVECNASTDTAKDIYGRTNYNVDTLSFYTGSRNNFTGNDISGTGHIMITLTYRTS